MPRAAGVSIGNVAVAAPLGPSTVMSWLAEASPLDGLWPMPLEPWWGLLSGPWSALAVAAARKPTVRAVARVKRDRGIMSVTLGVEWARVKSATVKASEARRAGLAELGEAAPVANGGRERVPRRLRAAVRYLLGPCGGEACLVAGRALFAFGNRPARIGGTRTRKLGRARACRGTSASKNSARAILASRRTPTAQEGASPVSIRSTRSCVWSPHKPHRSPGRGVARKKGTRGEPWSISATVLRSRRQPPVRCAPGQAQSP